MDDSADALATRLPPYDNSKAFRRTHPADTSSISTESDLSPTAQAMMKEARRRLRVARQPQDQGDANSPSPEPDFHEISISPLESDLSPEAQDMMRKIRKQIVTEREIAKLKLKRMRYELERRKSQESHHGPTQTSATLETATCGNEEPETNSLGPWSLALGGRPITSLSGIREAVPPENSTSFSITASTLLSICNGTRQRPVLSRHSSNSNSNSSSGSGSASQHRTQTQAGNQKNRGVTRAFRVRLPGGRPGDRDGDNSSANKENIKPRQESNPNTKKDKKRGGSTDGWPVGVTAVTMGVSSYNTIMNEGGSGLVIGGRTLR
jgi:hypothetical protein